MGYTICRIVSYFFAIEQCHSWCPLYNFRTEMDISVLAENSIHVCHIYFCGDIQFKADILKFKSWHNKSNILLEMWKSSRFKNKPFSGSNNLFTSILFVISCEMIKFHTTWEILLGWLLLLWCCYFLIKSLFAKPSIKKILTN